MKRGAADLPEPYGLKAATTSGAVRQYSKRRSLAQQLVLLKKLRLNMVDEMIDYKQVVFRIMSFAYLRLQTIQPTDEYVPDPCVHPCGACRVRIGRCRNPGRL